MTSRIDQKDSEIDNLKTQLKESQITIEKYQKKLSENEASQLLVEKKFEEWNQTFTIEQGKLSDTLKKYEIKNNQLIEEKQQLAEVIRNKDKEINDMKLKITSKDALLTSAGDLHYEMIQAQEDSVDQSAIIDGTIDEEESKMDDLSNTFTRKRDGSIVEGDEAFNDEQQPDMEDDELANLGNMNSNQMSSKHEDVDPEYAELDYNDTSDIFAVDERKQIHFSD